MAALFFRLRRAAAWLLLSLISCGLPLAYATADAAASSELALRATAIFEEPLIPTGPTNRAENDALAAAIAHYRRQQTVDDLQVFERFLVAHPRSVWRVSLLTNLGLANYHYGYFSRALSAWEDAWREGRAVESPAARAQVDRAVGELARMHARLGHRDRLAALLQEIGDRPLAGPATEALAGAKEALWAMRHDPGIAYLCGPKALKNLMLAANRSAEQTAFLDRYRSGPDGVNLAQVAKLARQGDQPHTLAFRQKGAELPLPALVHWKVDHFAAIVGEENGRYHLKDPTFGADLWITRDALEAESSGYFLLPSAHLPQGFRAVNLAEAARVYGRGITGDPVKGATSPDDEKGDCSCAAGGGSAGAAGGPGIGGPNAGMVGVNFHSLVVSINLTDTPIGYQPPKGPPVFVTLTYNQREADQPAVFNFSNVGPKWTTNWLSYIQDDPSSAGARVMRYIAGGGSLDYGGYNGTTGLFGAETRNGARLRRVAGVAISYERQLPDGTVEIYAEPDGATTYPRRIFLSRIVDPAGNAVTLGYDSMRRLETITDALGQVTRFGYHLTDAPLLITDVTDPFGRVARFSYNSSGRLEQIADTIGLTSQFAYDASGLVTSMTTPYGTTRFAFGGSGVSRWLEITDPLNQTERVEFRHNAGFGDGERRTPAGMTTFNRYIDSRNTFFWSKALYPITHTDYTKAEIKHWLHHPTGGYTSPVLESVKRPLESRIWYSYPGQVSPYTYSGTLDKPSAVGRVRDDNSTQLTRYTYNAFGHPLTVTDPMGNQTLYDYADNQIDVVRIRQKTSTGNYMTLADYTYDNRHRMLTHTDANGQTTHYTYNTAGQLATVTDALARVTRYNYDGRGYLVSVIDASGHVQSALTYDGYGRVATRTDAVGNTLSFQYDDLNRLTRVTWPDGTYYRYEWDRLDLATITDRLGRVTRRSYDANRNLVAVTDPAGRTTTYTYYPDGKLQSRTDAAGGTTHWTRDIQGRVTSITDPKGVVTRYAYDLLGNLRTIESPDAGTTQFSYDAGNRLIGKTDGRGIQTLYAYDWMNRLTGVSYPARPEENVSYVYDYNYFDPYENNRLTYLEDADGYTLFARDAVGNILAKANWLKSGAGALEYTYDHADRIARIVYPSGRIVLYTRDAAGRITQISTQDSANSPAYTLARDITYEPFGPIRQVKFGNGAVTTYQRDAAWRPTRILTLSTPATMRDYSYDAAGNVIAITDPLGPWDKSYVFDPLYRLTRDDNSRLPGVFDYDANGNRAGGTLGYLSFTQSQASGSNRLADFLQSVSSDGAGNVTGGGLSPVTYRYNNAGRMAQSNGGSGETAYFYDGFGLRTAKHGEERIHYDYLLDGRYADSIALDADGNYRQVAEYIWLDDTPVAQIKTVYGSNRAVVSRVLTYIHADHLNTPRFMTDASRKVVWRWDDDAFGIVTPEEDPDADGVFHSLDLGFAGQIADRAETGLFYNISRYYDPFTGRYLQADPIGIVRSYSDPVLKLAIANGLLAIGREQDEYLPLNHPYTYALNNPVSYIDPSGLVETGTGSPSARGWSIGNAISRPNGNIFDGFNRRQDFRCSSIAFPLNISEKAKQCCAKHDQCYIDNQCNQSSWVSTMLGGTKACNACNSEAFHGIVGF